MQYVLILTWISVKKKATFKVHSIQLEDYFTFVKLILLKKTKGGLSFTYVFKRVPAAARSLKRINLKETICADIAFIYDSTYLYKIIFQLS